MDVSNIEVSLSKGRLFVKRDFVLFAILLVVSFIFPLLTIILPFIPEMEWESDVIIAMVIGNLLSIALMALSIFAIVRDKKVKSEVQLWLKDAVKITAIANYAGEIRFGFQAKATKIQVDFVLDGKHYYRESTVKILGGEAGYNSAFNKYVNKYVRIMYSPKYDEVMIIKNQKSKK